jgi:sulfite reductase (NADPH) hemoprotein beta-component
MHAVQTSGNCIRNITSDHFAGVAPDELVDPRPYCELLRQWSTFHPEFAFLPRKFKIAVNAAAQDRAVIRAHDIGLEVVSDERGEIGFKVLVGGGLGRTPILGKVVREFLPRRHILSYLEAILRLYNRYGRRDNMYKARIKILVQALGDRRVCAPGRGRVGAPARRRDDGARRRVRPHRPPFRAAGLGDAAGEDPVHSARLPADKAFANWVKRCVHAHKTPRLRRRDAVAEGAGSRSRRHQRRPDDRRRRPCRPLQLRRTARQPRTERDPRRRQLRDLHEVWQIARSQRLATANIGLLTDMICCPGGDLCSLANARSLPIADAVHDKFDDLDYLYDIGDISLNISGCMNSCGHHHVANIGILGVDKNDEEWYQITVGGQQGNGATIGKVIGPSFYAQEVPEVIEALINVYLEQRTASERFIDTWQRVGVEPFKARAYAGRDRRRTAKVAGTGSNAKEIVNA